MSYEPVNFEGFPLKSKSKIDMENNSIKIENIEDNKKSEILLENYDDIKVNKNMTEQTEYMQKIKLLFDNLKKTEKIVPINPIEQVKPDPQININKTQTITPVLKQLGDKYVGIGAHNVNLILKETPFDEKNKKVELNKKEELIEKINKLKNKFQFLDANNINEFDDLKTLRNKYNKLRFDVINQLNEIDDPIHQIHPKKFSLKENIDLVSSFDNIGLKKANICDNDYFAINKSDLIDKMKEFALNDNFENFNLDMVMPTNNIDELYLINKMKESPFYNDFKNVYSEMLDSPDNISALNSFKKFSDLANKYKLPFIEKLVNTMTDEINEKIYDTIDYKK